MLLTRSSCQSSKYSVRMQYCLGDQRRNLGAHLTQQSSNSIAIGRECAKEKCAHALVRTTDTNKITYNNVTEYDLHTAGSVWLEIESSATYGQDKSFPGGSYTAIVTAECIAN